MHLTTTTMTNTDQVRRTRQRALIWAYLGLRDEFLTAQQIHDRLRAGPTPVSLPTIYRSVTAMAEAGDLDVLVSHGISAYRRCSPTHHHHLVCRQCSRTIEVTGIPLEQWALATGEEHGFVDIAHITELTGVCPSCQMDTSQVGE